MGYEDKEKMVGLLKFVLFEVDVDELHGRLVESPRPVRTSDGERIICFGHI